ncbi:MAG: glutathione peroxidase [Pseudomonadota bacterium]
MFGKIFSPLLMIAAFPALATEFTFDSIDGGEIRLSAAAGPPAVIVNTASMCGFTPQYEALQTLYETYSPQGVLVLAVPSDDFNQEYEDANAVKEFCEVNFGLTMPMTDITSVRGRNVHPFYAWLRDETGFVPRWNFNKVLLDGNGQIAATFGSGVTPMSQKLTSQIDTLLQE